MAIAPAAIPLLTNPMEGAVRDVKDLLASALRAAHAVWPALGCQISLEGFLVGELFEVFFERHAWNSSTLKMWCRLGANSSKLVGGSCRRERECAAITERHR